MEKKIRFALMVFLTFVLVAPVAAASNQQKIFSLDSDVHQAIEFLYMAQGLGLPSTTGPYSQAELTLMMEKINRAQLNENLMPTYDYVVKQLGIEPKIQGKGIGISWNFDATLEAYLHSNTTDFVGRETWIRGFNEQKPLLGVALETWPANNFYGYSEFTVGNTNTLKNGFGSSVFGSNIPMVPPAEIWDLDFNMPYRAFVAAGGDHWSFQLGRDRLNWGAGTSGNLMLSDTFKYHNLARITTFSDRFKYTFLTSFFPHPMHYYDTVANGQDDGPIQGAGQTALQNGLYFFMSHRLEGRLFKDKVGLALTESIMYQSEENYFDLRFLNPAAIFHNYYIRSNANSVLALELDYTPIKGLNIYMQAAVDEFSMPGEDKPSATKANFPEAFGLLGGVKAVAPLQGLMAHGSLEFAYTDPYLYLRYLNNSTPKTGGTPDDYGLNYVGAIREFTNGADTQYNQQFLGYTYGNDALVVNLNGGVKSFGKWTASTNLFYMAHGTFDMFTVFNEVGKDQQPLVSTPTDNGNDAFGNYLDSGYAARNAVSHTIVAGVKGSYQILDCLKAFGQLDYINVINYQNKAGAKTHDVQLSIGVTYSI